MNLKDFLELYDNWNGKIKINDNNLDTIIEDYGVKVYDKCKSLYNKRVLSFGYIDETKTLTIRINYSIDKQCN